MLFYCLESVLFFIYFMQQALADALDEEQSVYSVQIQSINDSSTWIGASIWLCQTDTSVAIGITAANASPELKASSTTASMLLRRRRSELHRKGSKRKSADAAGNGGGKFHGSSSSFPSAKQRSAVGPAAAPPTTPTTQQHRRRYGLQLREVCPEAALYRLSPHFRDALCLNVVDDDAATYASHSTPRATGLSYGPSKRCSTLCPGVSSGADGQRPATLSLLHSSDSPTPRGNGGSSLLVPGAAMQHEASSSLFLLPQATTATTTGAESAKNAVDGATPNGYLMPLSHSGRVSPCAARSGNSSILPSPPLRFTDASREAVEADEMGTRILLTPPLNTTAQSTTVCSLTEGCLAGQHHPRCHRSRLHHFLSPSLSLGTPDAQLRSHLNESHADLLTVLLTGVVQVAEMSGSGSILPGETGELRTDDAPLSPNVATPAKTKKSKAKWKQLVGYHALQRMFFPRRRSSPPPHSSSFSCSRHASALRQAEAGRRPLRRSLSRTGTRIADALHSLLLPSAPALTDDWEAPPVAATLRIQFAREEELLLFLAEYVGRFSVVSMTKEQVEQLPYYISGATSSAPLTSPLAEPLRQHGVSSLPSTLSTSTATAAGQNSHFWHHGTRIPNGDGDDEAREQNGRDAAGDEFSCSSPVALDKRRQAMMKQTEGWMEYLRFPNDPRLQLPFASVPLYLWHSFLPLAPSVLYCCERGYLIAERVQGDALPEGNDDAYFTSQKQRGPVWQNRGSSSMPPISSGVPLPRQSSNSYGSHGVAVGESGGAERPVMGSSAPASLVPELPPMQWLYATPKGDIGAAAAGRFTFLSDIFLCLSESHFLFVNSFGNLKFQCSIDEVVILAHGGAVADFPDYPFIQLQLCHSDGTEGVGFVLTFSWLPEVPTPPKEQRSSIEQLLRRSFGPPSATKSAMYASTTPTPKRGSKLPSDGSPSRFGSTGSLDDLATFSKGRSFPVEATVDGHAAPTAAASASSATGAKSGKAAMLPEDEKRRVVQRYQEFLAALEVINPRQTKHRTLQQLRSMPEQLPRRSSLSATRHTSSAPPPHSASTGEPSVVNSPVFPQTPSTWMARCYNTQPLLFIAVSAAELRRTEPVQRQLTGRGGGLMAGGQRLRQHHPFSHGGGCNLPSCIASSTAVAVVFTASPWSSEDEGLVVCNGSSDMEFSMEAATRTMPVLAEKRPLVEQFGAEGGGSFFAHSFQNPWQGEGRQNAQADAFVPMVPKKKKSVIVQRRQVDKM